MKKIIVCAAALAASALSGCSDGKDGDLAGNPTALEGAWRLTWENSSITDLGSGKTESDRDDCSDDGCYLRFAGGGTYRWCEDYGSDYFKTYGPFGYSYDPGNRKLRFFGEQPFSDLPCTVETLTASKLALVWEGTETWTTEDGTEYDVRYREESVFERVESSPLTGD